MVNLQNSPIDQSYLKLTSETIKTQNFGSSLMKLSWSDFNLRLPDAYLVHSYLIATVPKILFCHETSQPIFVIFFFSAEQIYFSFKLTFFYPFRDIVTRAMNKSINAISYRFWPYFVVLVLSWNFTIHFYYFLFSAEQI